MTRFGQRRSQLCSDVYYPALAPFVFDTYPSSIPHGVINCAIVTTIRHQAAVRVNSAFFGSRGCGSTNARSSRVSASGGTPRSIIDAKYSSI